MIINGDCLEVLKTLPSNHVDCCVTSPPYYNLRDYENEKQIGLEATPYEYIEKLVRVFREVKRVLKDEGTLWINIGDSYSGSGKGAAHYPDTVKETKQSTNTGSVGYSKIDSGYKDNIIKPKDLIGIPWMLAFALRADGWYLRQDIIWHKPNPMPESVTDRCTKAHEYIFLLSKSPHYFYDSEAIKEPTVYPIGSRADKKRGDFKGKYHAHEEFKHISDSFRAIRNTRNKRDVWSVSTKPFRGAHFATFPKELIEPCILAGCPVGGIVLDCFFGSGTVGEVAVENSRDFIGIDVNKKYCEMATKRVNNTQIKLELIN